MENEKNDLSLQMEDPCNEQINSNNNRVVLKELLSSNLTKQDNNCKSVMESSFEKVKTNNSTNLLTDLSFEDETLTSSKLRKSLSKLNSLTEEEAGNLNTRTTTDNQQPMNANNWTLITEDHINESITCEPMDIDEDIADYLISENATTLVEKTKEFEDKQHQENNVIISISNENNESFSIGPKNDSKVLEDKTVDGPEEKNKDLNFNSTFGSKDLLNESMNEAQTQASHFPVTNQIIDSKVFPRSPNKNDPAIEINSQSFETKADESRTLNNLEIISQPKNNTFYNESESEKSFEKFSNETELNNLLNIKANEKNDLSIEKDCEKIESIIKVGLEENKDLNLNFTFDSNNLSNDQNISFNESAKEQIAPSSVFPMESGVLDSKSIPKSPNKNDDSIEINSTSSETYNNRTTESVERDSEENAESIYNKNLAMKSDFEGNASTENNLINFVAAGKEVGPVEKKETCQTLEVNVDNPEQNKDLNSTFCSNDLPSDDITASFAFPVKIKDTHYIKSPINNQNSESSENFKAKDNSKTTESAELLQKEKGELFSNENLLEIPAFHLDTVCGEKNGASALPNKSIENIDQHEIKLGNKSPNLSPTAKNVSSSLNNFISNVDNNLAQNNNYNDDGIFAKPQNKQQVFEKFDDREGDAKEFYDNFVVEPYDFDYLLTKGNNCVQVDRTSLLLRFDPLLGAPVPVNANNSKQQFNRLENVLQAKQIESTHEEELHEIQYKELNIFTPTKTENPQRNPSHEDKKMSADVVCELETNEALSCTITNVEDSNNMEDMENKIKNEVLKTEDLEKKLKDAEQREEALIKRITEKEKMLNKVNGVVEAYEKAIAELVAEKGEIIQSYEKQLADVKADRDSNYRHLTSLETTFSDLHVKYEKSKEMTQQLQASTDMLLEDKRRALEDLRLQEQRYLKMKSHAMQQLEIANKQLASLTKEHGIEITKLKALLKKEEISRASINEQLHQKSRENAELMKICDELINGQGS